MAHGLEMHLAQFYRLIRDFDPQVVVVDPISNIGSRGSLQDTTDMLVRLVDLMKSRGITALLTSLTSASGAIEGTNTQISSLVDTWLLLRDVELGGERNRAIYVLKSRGMAHSNQIREFLLTAQGIELADVYLGPEGVLTGSARQAQEAREKASFVLRDQEIQGRQRELERKRDALEARIAALRKEFEVEESESMRGINQELAREQVLREDRSRMSRSRQSDNGSSEPAPQSRPGKTQRSRR
jgi:circadian clock protein KaiC